MDSTHSESEKGEGKTAASHQESLEQAFTEKSIMAAELEQKECKLQQQKERYKKPWTMNCELISLIDDHNPLK